MATATGDPDTSQGTSMTYAEAWLPGWDGLNFYTRTYTASSPRAVAVFVHGFAEYVGRYEWAHGVYASKSITVFAFDQRGFGLTALDMEHKSKESKYGKTSWADQFADLEWWLKYVKDKFPTLPIFLAGHSMVRHFVRWFFLSRFLKLLTFVWSHITSGWCPVHRFCHSQVSPSGEELRLACDGGCIRKPSAPSHQPSISHRAVPRSTRQQGIPLACHSCTS